MLRVSHSASANSAHSARGHESWSCRQAQQRALQGSRTAGRDVVQADSSSEMGPQKERPWKMLLTENPDKVMVVSRVTG